MSTLIRVKGGLYISVVIRSIYGHCFYRCKKVSVSNFGIKIEVEETP